MDQAKSPKSLVWRKKNKGFIKSCTSKGNKAGHDGKVARFFVPYRLVKGFATVSITRNLVVKYLLNFWKTTLLRFSKVAVTPPGMFFFKKLIQVKTPKLLKML